MWIKTKDGRLHDTTGCTIESVLPRMDAGCTVQITPRSGKPIVLAENLTADERTAVLVYIEDGIANGRQLIQL